MLTEFADDVMNRFKDPSMHHQLASILMNSTSKLNARVIPSILDARAKGVLPKKLCFAVAAYIALYHDAEGVPVKVNRAGGKTGEFIDDAYAVEVLKKAWSVYQKNEASALFTVKTVLSDTKLWGINLSNINKNNAPTVIPTIAGTYSGTVLFFDSSIAGIISDQTLAATIIPEAKPKHILSNLKLILLKNKTIAAPRAVVKNVRPVPKNTPQYIFKFSKNI